MVGNVFFCFALAGPQELDFTQPDLFERVRQKLILEKARVLPSWFKNNLRGSEYSIWQRGWHDSKSQEANTKATKALIQSFVGCIFVVGVWDMTRASLGPGEEEGGFSIGRGGLQHRKRDSSVLGVHLYTRFPPFTCPASAPRTVGDVLFSQGALRAAGRIISYRIIHTMPSSPACRPSAPST